MDSKRPVEPEAPTSREVVLREWSDFDVEVTQHDQGEPYVKVLNSPRDRPTERFHPPYSPEQQVEILAGLADRVGRDVARANGGTDRATEPNPPTVGFPPPAEIGGRLSAALFSGKVGEAFAASLATQGENRAGLRLRIWFDPLAESLTTQAALPWELVYDADKDRFLGHDATIAIERYLDVAKVIRWPPIDGDLRVLLVAAEPVGEDIGPSGARAEQEAIYQTLRTTDKVTAVRAPRATFAKVCEALATEGHHILHFMGHGCFDETSNVAAVGFEDDTGGCDTVTAEKLAAELAKIPSLRMVVLNACSSATVPKAASPDPLTGVAVALVQAGIPAVVGMQFPISLSAANLFGVAFYRHLAHSGVVDAAMAAARAALAAADQDSLEWITPVLFSRLQSGKLFEPESATPADGPRRIGIQSYFGWGAEVERWSQVFLPLTRFFRDRYILDGVDWAADVYPPLRSFLLSETAGMQSIHLQMPVHQTIAYAIGQVLPAKAGLEIVITQQVIHKRVTWQTAQVLDPEPWSWVESAHPRMAEGSEFAFAIAPTRPVLPHAELYVRAELPEVREILHFEPPKHIGQRQDSVYNGWHALTLATHLSNRMDELEGLHPGSKFHIFFAGPNALLLYLGRLVRPGLDVQLYEFDFDGKGGYTPSLRFPVET